MAKQKSPQKQDDITAIHINWTLPFRYRNPDVPYFVDDFELLSTTLSALLWRRFNGPVKLYTDLVGRDYYQQLGMLDLWDAGYNDTTLDIRASDGINPEIFWAGGKLLAIRQEQAPFCMMDTDLLVWRPLRVEIGDRKIMALHRESLNDYYLPLHLLKKRPGYQPNPDWDWYEDPCNTALVYFGNQTFLQEYTRAAIDFMIDNNERPSEMITQMVFAEQRIFSMVAKAQGLYIATFLQSPDQERGITHLWGAKAEARDNPDKNNALCHELCRSLDILFPESKDIPIVNELHNKYMK